MSSGVGGVLWDYCGNGLFAFVADIGSCGVAHA